MVATKQHHSCPPLHLASRVATAVAVCQLPHHPDTPPCPLLPPPPRPTQTKTHTPVAPLPPVPQGGESRSKKKVMKASDKFKFNFDWDNKEDTSRDLNPLYNNLHREFFGG